MISMRALGGPRYSGLMRPSSSDVIALSGCVLAAPALAVDWVPVAVVAPASGFGAGAVPLVAAASRSEEHTFELQSLMRTSYAVFCLKQKKQTHKYKTIIH